MTQPTRAAWKKALVNFESAFNLLMGQEIDQELREALFLAHDALRTRASGVVEA